MRKVMLFLGILIYSNALFAQNNTAMKEQDDAYWKDKLSDLEYHVLREKGTERPFTGAYDDFYEVGLYSCKGCGQDLFLSDAKFASHCGWPSFFKPIKEDALTETRDESHGMIRTEITCSNCGGHLGHVFKDGPPPTGLRYCMNSVSLNFKPLSEEDQK
ncbi:peptide-methionine (R)-S-oxide reductase MsrB [Persicobacter diffluens]|uniref:Peptide methionine sulfoxide reductase MsrB n=1 Tax=Persicobacter diffluens TaxID=981 RepID=A0AAN4VW53_9BACT|nr:peptide methionine sulfoxide reductase MsrB [Persicobacter diffluens]